MKRVKSSDLKDEMKLREVLKEFGKTEESILKIFCMGMDAQKAADKQKVG